MNHHKSNIRSVSNTTPPRKLRGILAACAALMLLATTVFAVASSPSSSQSTPGSSDLGPRTGLVFSGESVTQPVIAPGGATNIDADAVVSHATHTENNHGLTGGATPEITCALDSAQTSNKFATVTPDSSDGCLFTATANSGSSAEGNASFLVIFTSNVRDPLGERIEDPPGSGTMVRPFYELRHTFWVTISSDIVFTPPTGLAVQAGGTLLIDASGYASHAHVMTGSPQAPATVTCGAPTSRVILEETRPEIQISGPRRLHSRLASVTRADATNNPCSYTVVAESELVLIDSDGNRYHTGVANTGTASFVVPYTSSHSVTVDGTPTPVSGYLDITLDVTSAAAARSELAEGDTPYPMIEPLDITECATTYGAFDGHLLRDCRALVTAQNHWAAVEANRNLGIEHPLRSWGQGIYKFIDKWPGVTAGSAVTSLDLRGWGIRGSLPVSLVNLRNLINLDISDNYFTGEIPAVWSNFAKDVGHLTTFSFCNNYLDGDIPASLIESFKDGELHFATEAAATTRNLLINYYWLTDRTDVTCQEAASYPPPSPIRVLGSAYAVVGTGGQAVLKLVKDLGLSFVEEAGIPLGYRDENTPDGEYVVYQTTAAPLYVWNPTTMKWKQSTEYHCIARSTPGDTSSSCTRWRMTWLPANSLFYYVDGYVDCRTLVSLNLNSGRTPASGCSDLTAYHAPPAPRIVFTPPADLTVAAGEVMNVDVGAHARDPNFPFQTITCTLSSTGVSGLLRFDPTGNCAVRITAAAAPRVASCTGMLTITYSSTKSGAAIGDIPVTVTGCTPGLRDDRERSGGGGGATPVATSASGTGGGEGTDEAAETTVWNTFTVSSMSRVTVAQIREQLSLGEDRDIYVWNGERQAWTEVPSETAVLPDGAVVTFESAEEVSEEDLGDLDLAAGTQYATLTPGWTILNSPGTTSRVHTRSRNFFLTSTLIDCSSRNYVLAVARYNSDNGQWYLWLPCHPRQEEALTQRGSAFRRLTTMNEGDLTWIYCRCTGNRHIQWNADILKYEPL